VTITFSLFFYMKTITMKNSILSDEIQVVVVGEYNYSVLKYRKTLPKEEHMPVTLKRNDQRSR